MECKNCGCPLPDDARFCRQCGQPVGGAVQAGTPAAGGDAPQAAGGTFTMAETPPQAPGLPGGALGTAQPEAALAVGGAQVRRKGAKLLAGIVAAVVVLAGLCIWLLYTLLAGSGSPKGALAAAMARTGALWAREAQEGWQQLGLAAPEGASQGGWDITLEGGTGDAAQVGELLRGFGLGVAWALDEENELGLSQVELLYAGQRLADLEMYLDGDTLALGSPSLLGQDYYALNGPTLYDDLNANPLFGPVEATGGVDFWQQDAAGLSAGTLARFAELGGQLWGHAQVERGGQAEFQAVNGEAVQAQLYTLNLPLDALRQFTADVFVALLNDPFVLAEAGLAGTQGGTEQMEAQLRGEIDEFFAGVAQAYPDGAVPVEVSVADKVVRRAVLLDGQGAKLALLDLGAGGRMAGNLALVLDGGATRIGLTGKTELTSGEAGTVWNFWVEDAYGSEPLQAILQANYRPGDGGCSAGLWVAEGDETLMELGLTGRLSAQDGQVQLEMDDCGLSIQEGTLLFSFDMRLAPLQGDAFAGERALHPLAGLTEAELEEIGYRLSNGFFGAAMANPQLMSLLLGGV